VWFASGLNSTAVQIQVGVFGSSSKIVKKKEAVCPAGQKELGITRNEGGRNLPNLSLLMI
jgi:hypothetical protein